MMSRHSAWCGITVAFVPKAFLCTVVWYVTVLLTLQGCGGGHEYEYYCKSTLQKPVKYSSKPSSEPCKEGDSCDCFCCCKRAAGTRWDPLGAGPGCLPEAA